MTLKKNFVIKTSDPNGRKRLTISAYIDFADNKDAYLMGVETNQALTQITFKYRYFDDNNVNARKDTKWTDFPFDWGSGNATVTTQMYKTDGTVTNPLEEDTMDTSGAPIL